VVIFALIYLKYNYRLCMVNLEVISPIRTSLILQNGTKTYLRMMVNYF